MATLAKRRLAPRLASLLEPRSVAVIGASPAEHGGIVGAIRAFGFTGAIYPVNPKYDAIEGYRCYPSIGEAPEAVDLALVAVRSSSVLAVVEECVASGAGAVIVHSAGFAELGPEGAAEQAAIASIGVEAGVPILGPNCQGIANIERRLCVSSNAVFRAHPDLSPGPIAWVSQSGAVGGIVVSKLRELGLGVSHWVSTGNECDVDVAEVIEYLLEQGGVRVVCAYVEGIKSPERWRSIAALAKAARARVIVLHGGTTPDGAKASQSHTASLASSQVAGHAFLQQLEVALPSDLDALVAAAAVAAAQPELPREPRLAVIANSGGVGVLMADACQRLGLPLASLASETEVALRNELPPYVSPGNPLDVPMLIGRDPDVVRRIVDILARDPEPPDIVILCLHSVYDADWGAAFDVDRTLSSLALIGANRGPDDPLTLPVFLSGEPDLAAKARARGLLAFANMTALLAGLAGLSHPKVATRSGAPEPGISVQTSTGHRPFGTTALSEVTTKARLRDAGLPVPAGGLARTPPEAAVLAAALGFPVAVKLSSADLLHKSDIGGVALGIASEVAVEEAARAVLDAGRRVLPDTSIDGVLVEEMGVGGAELIVGVRRDPQLGRIVLVGQGGLDVEALGRVAMRILPITEHDVRAMLSSAGLEPMLIGSRGRPPRDVAALVRLILNVGELVSSTWPEVVELDLNPVLVRGAGEGVLILDAVAFVDARGPAPASEADDG